MGYGMNEELGSDGAFFTLERNLFEEAHGEAAEIISIKSNRNVVRFNTFRKTKGGITNRSGNFNVIEGNFILGEGEPRSYGIRVTGPVPSGGEQPGGRGGGRRPAAGHR